MGSQATFSYKFSTAGTFEYVCSIHPFMHATVVVTQ
jgi:plastocyanin